MILALLHGAGDFDESLKIVNTCGWDTDCNSANVGCILGVRNGLAGISPKWRDPVADRLYLPNADGGRSITDAANEAIHVANAGRRLAGLDPIGPKPRFNFELPGSVQGWQEARHEDGALRIVGRASTPTFIPLHTKDMVTGYMLVANPTLFPGHRVRAIAREGQGRLFLSHYGPEDASITVEGPVFDGGEAVWTIPEVGGYPIYEIGVEGDVLLESMDWRGVPSTSWPPVEGTMPGRAWVDALDRFNYVRDRFDFLVQNEGVGLLTQGSRDWDDYRVTVRLVPRLAKSCGVVIRCQGLRRYVAFLFGAEGEVRFDRCQYGRKTLARAGFDWHQYAEYEVELEAEGNTFRAFIDGKLVLTAQDDSLASGGFGFVVEEGCLGAGTPEVSPL
ncbi:ADP-ribosylglycohydrolase family protein [bacterium]|nr:MAG: ADP-ribosylglycohydrolase family protein [bacterium]